MVESGRETVLLSNEMSEPATKPLTLGDIRPGRADNAPGQEATGASLGAVAADPDAAPPRPARSRLRETATILAAGSVHVLALFALISVPASQYGSGGNALDAISVSIVPSSALETREAVPAPTPSAAPGAVAPNEGDAVAAATASPDKQRETTPEKTTLPEPLREQPPETAETPAAPPEPAPEAASQQAPVMVDRQPPPEPPEVRMTALADPQPRPPESAEEQRKVPEEPTNERDEVAEAPSPETLQTGGVASRGVAPELPPAPAAAAASPGEVNAYGRAVQEALLAVDQTNIRARKALSRSRGTTIVRFAIRSDGTLDSADVAISSGRRELDEAAITLVRLTNFPRPPPSLSDTQRTYSAPIVFKP